MTTLDIDDMVRAATALAAVRSSYVGEIAAPCDACGSWADVPCSGPGGPKAPCPGRADAARRRRHAQQSAAVDLARRQLLADLAEADVPDELVTALTGEVKDTEALAQVRAWRESDRTSLLLCGARGVGKSFAAAWALARGPRRPGGPGSPRAVWLHAAELAALDSGDKRLLQLRRCGVLVVDELGCGDTRPERLRERLDSVWSVRLDRGLDTLVTSNLSIAEASQLLDERLRDRLRRHGQADGLEDTKSLRSGRTA